MMVEAVGWLSSFVLVLTIGRQVHRQWRTGHSEGVSSWFFIGQMTASSGFTAYSYLVRNWVFVVTNAMLFLSAIAGYLIVLAHRRRARSEAGDSVREPE
jgi:MtN3 and saliva related transmembrane protein